MACGESESARRAREASSLFLGDVSAKMDLVFAEYVERWHSLWRPNGDTSNEAGGIGSVLLHGQSGSGKSLLLSALAAKHGIKRTITVRAADYYTWPRTTMTRCERLSEELHKAVAHSFDETTLLIIDNCNEILAGVEKRASNGEEAADGQEEDPAEDGGSAEDEALARTILSFLYNVNGYMLCDGDHPAPLVVFISRGSQEALHSVHPVWGTADLTLEMPGSMNEAQRRMALALLEEMSSNGPELSASALDSIAYSSAGMPVCDLNTLLIKARTIDQDTDLATLISAESRAILRGRRSPIEKVSWCEVGGQQVAKRQLVEAAEALTDPKVQHIYRLQGLEGPRGILLHGPPGTGKTLLARAFATHCNAHFVHVPIPRIVHATIGDSEKAIRAVFEEALRHQPSVVFFDEIDAIVDDDDMRIVTQIEEEMDRLATGGGNPLPPPWSNGNASASVMVLANTNLIDRIPLSLQTFNRFESKVYVGGLGLDTAIDMIVSAAGGGAIEAGSQEAQQLAERLGEELGQLVASADLALLIGRDPAILTGAAIVQLIDRAKWIALSRRVKAEGRAVSGAFDGAAFTIADLTQSLMERLGSL